YLARDGSVLVDLLHFTVGQTKLTLSTKCRKTGDLYFVATAGLPGIHRRTQPYRLAAENASRLSLPRTDKAFFAWGDVQDTFTRASFHDVFKSKILPFLNPWPLPRSIVVMDNPKIHMYKELQEIIHETGALLFFLPPFSPNLKPIEVGFSLLMRWIQRHGNMAFRENPLTVLRVAMYYCTRQKEEVGENLHSHCGYKRNALSIKEI
ncbi:hypothetical protein JG688_00017268, partial [Phytophthora aleatoria]